MYNQKPLSGDLLDYGDWSTDGLVYLGLFHEGSGDTAADLSGNGNTGTLVGDTHFVPGKFGSVLDFDGTGDRVELSSTITLGSKATVIAWIKVVKETTSCVVGKADIFNNPILIIDGSDRFYIGNGTIQRYWTYPDGTFNEWTQVAAVCNGTNAEAFINGVGLGGKSLPHLGFVDWIGSGHAYKFTGQIDHVLIYNRDLAAGEIAELYQNPFRMIRTKRRRIGLITEEITGAPPTTFPYYYREIASRRIA